VHADRPIIDGCGCIKRVGSVIRPVVLNGRYGKLERLIQTLRLALKLVSYHVKEWPYVQDFEECINSFVSSDTQRLTVLLGAYKRSSHL
jgi:hypothetical protein